VIVQKQQQYMKGHASFYQTVKRLGIIKSDRIMDGKGDQMQITFFSSSESANLKARALMCLAKCTWSPSDRDADFASDDSAQLSSLAQTLQQN